MTDAPSAFAAYQRALNQVLHGTEEPTGEQVCQWFDQRFGLWLPPYLLKRRSAT